MCGKKTLLVVAKTVLRRFHLMARLHNISLFFVKKTNGREKNFVENEWKREKIFVFEKFIEDKLHPSLQVGRGKIRYRSVVW